MNFIMSYDDAKKLLSALYQVPYGQVKPFVDILHKMKEEEGNLTLEERMVIEAQGFEPVKQEE